MDHSDSASDKTSVSHCQPSRTPGSVTMNDDASYFTLGSGNNSFVGSVNVGSPSMSIQSNSSATGSVYNTSTNLYNESVNSTPMFNGMNQSAMHNILPPALSNFNLILPTQLQSPRYSEAGAAKRSSIADSHINSGNINSSRFKEKHFNSAPGSTTSPFIPSTDSSNKPFSLKLPKGLNKGIKLPAIGDRSNAMSLDLKTVSSPSTPVSSSVTSLNGKISPIYAFSSKNLADLIMDKNSESAINQMKSEGKVKDDSSLLSKDEYELVILDVRAIAQYNHEHINSAVNIGLPTTLIKRSTWTIDTLLASEESDELQKRAHKLLVDAIIPNQTSLDTKQKNIIVCIVDDIIADRSSKRANVSELPQLGTLLKNDSNFKNLNDIIVGTPSNDSRAALIVSKLQQECSNQLRIGWLIGSLNKFKSLYPDLLVRQSNANNQTNGVNQGLSGLSLSGLRLELPTNDLSSFKNDKSSSCNICTDKNSLDTTHSMLNPKHKTHHNYNHQHCHHHKNHSTEAGLGIHSFAHDIFISENSTAIRTPNGAIRHMDDVSEIPKHFELFSSKINYLPKEYPHVLRKLLVQKPDCKTFIARQHMELKMQSRLQRQVGMVATSSGDMFCVSEGFGMHGKNRYNNILPYNYNRVKIKAPWVEYINASMITLPKCKYVATQAPMKSTIHDFWRMNWELNTPVVLMLCKEEEAGREQCVQYWPTLNDNELIEIDSLTTIKKKIMEQKDVSKINDSSFNDQLISSSFISSNAQTHKHRIRRYRSDSQPSGILKSRRLSGPLMNLNNNSPSNEISNTFNNVDKNNNLDDKNSNLTQFKLGNDDLMVGKDHSYYPVISVKRLQAWSYDNKKIIIQKLLVLQNDPPCSSAGTPMESDSSIGSDNSNAMDFQTDLSNSIENMNEHDSATSINSFNVNHLCNNNNNSSIKTCYLIQYRGWPDWGVPENTLDIVELSILAKFIGDIQQESSPTNNNCETSETIKKSNDKPPYVVHCSAGCGRTGTFIAVDYLLNYGEIFRLGRNFSDIIDLNFTDTLLNLLEKKMELKLLTNNNINNSELEEIYKKEEKEINEVMELPIPIQTIESIESKTQKSILGTLRDRCSFENITVEGLVEELRRQRQDMVQTVAQYGLIYECIFKVAQMIKSD